MNRKQITILLVITLFLLPVGVSTADHVNYSEDWEDQSLADYIILSDEGENNFISHAGGSAYQQVAQGDQFIQTSSQYTISTTGTVTVNSQFNATWENAQDTTLYSNIRIDDNNGSVILFGYSGETDRDGYWIRGTMVTDSEQNSPVGGTSGSTGWVDMDLTIDYDTDTVTLDVDNTQVASTELTGTWSEPNNISVEYRTRETLGGTMYGAFDNIESTDLTAGNTVSGTVNNSRTGNAVENANVRVFETDGTLVTETTTDANGDYSVQVDDGQYFFDYNKGTAYIDRQILNTVSGDETINVDLQPRRVVYTDASPRANEYIRNRTTTAFNLSINVSDPSGNQVNTTIFWFNETTNEFENIHQVNDWTDDLTIDIEFPEDANKGTNVWFASTNTTRGVFNSSANSPTNGYQFETPGNISIRDTPDPSTTLTDAEITAEIISLESGFTATRTTTSTGAGTWDGEIDLNDIPKEDYRITLESTDGTKYRDAILGLNADRVTDLNIAIMVDDNTFTTEDGWYAQEFQLNDNTGAWSPENVMLFLQQNVDGSYQEVGGDLFGTQNSAVIDVNDTTEYRLLLYHLQRGDSRSVGTFKADRDLSTEVVTINVDSVAPPPTEDNDEGYKILAFLLNVESSDPSLRVTFSDPEELTYEFNFEIYERGNQSNVLVEDDGAAHLGNATFTYDLSVNQTRTSWVVDWNATRDGELINGTLVVTGERLDPGVPVNTNARHGVAFLSILLVGGVVGGGARSDLGAVVVALMGGFFVFIGWMPSVVGMSVIVFALFVAILFNARIRGQTP